MRRFVVMLVAVFVFMPTGVSASTWVRPVPGHLVRPFEPPRTRYGPGHLGVDFFAAPGSGVRAAGPGVVIFAGQVGGELDVVIAHPGNLRTTYAFLSAISVHRGERVEAGAIVGRTGGTGDRHNGNVLHFGLRIGDTYVDPMQLFGASDVSAVVHLAPLVCPDACPNLVIRPG